MQQQQLSAQALCMTIDTNILCSPKNTYQVAFTVYRQAVTFNELLYNMQCLYTSFSVYRGFEKDQMNQSSMYFSDSGAID